MRALSYSVAQRLVSFALVALVGTPAIGQIRGQLVASGLSEPVAIVQVPGLADTALVVEQAGRIRIVQSGVVLPASYLDLTGQISAGGERGLLGLVLAPDYPSSGRFWVDFTDPAGNTVIARFRRSATSTLAADPTSRFDLVWPDGQSFITQPFANHNGGNLAFGPDGFLYVGMGDGGSANDPLNNAQNPQSLLGKMLRVDVNVPDSDPRGYRVPATNPFVGQPGVLAEIWAFGVRNPWRWSFDDPSHGGTGALVIGDVGQDAWEEIDYEPAGRGGRNYGWRIREGTHSNVTTLPPAFLPLTDPVFEYSHAVGHSITGGFIYRGSSLDSSLVGRYFFGDFVAGRIWSLRLVVDPQTGAATAGDLREHTAELGPVAAMPSSFGVDAAGEIYVVNYGTGTVYRLVPNPGGCITPDPFVALGGGTCVNGGWLPPGLAPGPPPPPPPPVAGGCVTPDPFVALGGGTCVNGGWLPPGIASAPPPPPPPPVAGACVTPDPFVVLGGGTCVNGGWLPPGIASAPPPSAPPPVAGGCVTPDPFVAIPGLVGVCVNGGWLPVSGAAGTGTMRLDASTAAWVIAADGGKTYVPTTPVAPAFMVDGLRVRFKVSIRPDLAASPAGLPVDVLTLASIVAPGP